MPMFLIEVVSIAIICGFIKSLYSARELIG